MSSHSFDKQLEVVDALLVRERKFVNDNRGKYASSFLAKKDHDISVLESVRETVREARQNKQMTGMGGKRIE